MCRRATAEESSAVFGRGSGGLGSLSLSGALLGSGMKALAESSSSAEPSPRTSPRASAQLSRPSADSSRSIDQSRRSGDPLSPGRTNLSLKSLSENSGEGITSDFSEKAPAAEPFLGEMPAPPPASAPLPTLNLSALGSKRTLSIDPLASPRSVGFST